MVVVFFLDNKFVLCFNNSSTNNNSCFLLRWSQKLLEPMKHKPRNKFSSWWKTITALFLFLKNLFLFLIIYSIFLVCCAVKKGVFGLILDFMKGFVFDEIIIEIVQLGDNNG
jgi:hypothetical protein